MRFPLVAVVAVLLIAVGCGDEVPVRSDVDPTTPGPAATDAPTTHDALSPSPSTPSPTTDPGGLEQTVESIPSEPRSELTRGDVGEQVIELQQELVRHGFEIKVDGRFGPTTEVAVKGFQFSNGLEADGVAGPDTWSTLSRTDANSTVVLRDDGLTIADFGESDAVVMPVLLEVLGAPESDRSVGLPFGCEQELCEGRERTVRWRSTDGAMFAVRFEQTGDVLGFVGWELSGFGGGIGMSLATTRGVALGSTASEMLSAYPDVDFGHHPEPLCGDAWWDPGAFKIDVDADDPTSGLRGSVGHDWDVMLGTLDAALIAQGIPEGLDCGEDVMCAAVFGKFQESVGLPFTAGLDRPTWVALGLPLPPSMDAEVHSLKAGRSVTAC